VVPYNNNQNYNTSYSTKLIRRQWYWYKDNKQCLCDDNRHALERSGINSKPVVVVAQDEEPITTPVVIHLCHAQWETKTITVFLLYHLNNHSAAAYHHPWVAEDDLHCCLPHLVEMNLVAAPTAAVSKVSM